MRPFDNLIAFYAKHCIVLYALFLAMFFLTDPAFADDFNNNKIVTTLCNVINMVTGGAGKAIAIIVIVSVAVGMFFGKVTWGLAIMVAVAVGIMFGADTIVGLVTGTSASNICPASS